MAGLTSTGITIKSVDEILADIEADELANIDPDLNVGADDVLGQLNGVFAAALGEAWELLEEIYQSAYPDTASGQSLSYVAALTGTIRQAAAKAEVNVACSGDPDVVIPAGTRCYPDGDPDSLFEFLTDFDIGPTGTDTTIIYAVNEGTETSAASFDEMVLTSAVPDLDTVVVVNGGFTEGSDEETDSELRLRREQTLALAGSSTVEAIRADMLTVTGVDTCTVFENPTSAIDANGVPPYAIEVLVYSAGAPSYDAQDVVDQIWLSKPAGTPTFGGLSGSAVDSLGVSHTMYYSVPDVLPGYIYIALTETVDGSYVGDGNVAQAIEDWASRSVSVGQNVYASDIINVVADIAGVETINVSTVRVDDSPARSTVDLTVTARQLVTIAAGDVIVVST